MPLDSIGRLCNAKDFFMNAAFSSRSTEGFNKEFEARKLQALPSRLPLQLVSTHGQIQIHTATYRGSFSSKGNYQS